MEWIPFVLLGETQRPTPIAEVVVRRPPENTQQTSARMLVDTGADLTLIPASAVASLGIEDDGQRIELQGFVPGVASTFPLVRLRIVFGGHIEQRRFPIIDDDVGILGRDLLQLFQLEVDGPRMQWRVSLPTP